MSTKAIIGICIFVAAVILIPVVVATIFEGFLEGLGVMYDRFTDGQVIRL